MKYLVRLLAGPTAVSICIAGLMLMAGAARAQVTQKGAVYEFHVRLKPGAKLDYAMKVNTTPPGSSKQSPPKPISVTTPLSGAITSVQNGVATIKVKWGPSVVNGQPQGEARDLEFKVDGQGRPVGAPPAQLQNLFGNLPDHPLKVGDSYTIKESVSFSGIPVAVTVRYKFLGLKTVGGQRCAAFTATVTGAGNLPMGQGASAPFTIRGAGVMQVAAADGLLTHSAGDVNVLISPGASETKMKVNTTLDRK